jgi:MinD-like ATPase involved in chromosome partitioning or flagellar assembly
MKIALCLQDERLEEELLTEAPGEKANWSTFGSVDALCEASKGNSYEYIIVSDRLTDYDRLSDTLETLRERQRKAKLLMLLSNRHHGAINEQYMKLCLAHDCAWVPPGRTVKSICEEVRRHIDAECDTSGSGTRRKIVLFLGSTPNIGTTVLAFGTAWRLAATTDHRVGYLCLNLKSSKLHRYVGHDTDVPSLDRLRAELKSGYLRQERLLHYCEQVKDNPNLHVLYGNMLREQAEFFTSEEIEHLLETARSTFDVCIVDVNAYWDNAATLCGILRSDSRMLVTTGDIGHFQEDINRWLHSLGTVFGILPQSFDLILTQCDKEDQGQVGARDIRRETRMHVAAEVAYLPELRGALNRGKLGDLLKHSHELQAALAPIVNAIAVLHELRTKPEKRRKRWLRRMLSETAAVS